MDNLDDFAVVSQIVSLLKDMDKETQAHIMNTVTTWLKIDVGRPKHAPSEQELEPPGLSQGPGVSVHTTGSQFTRNVEMTPKQFMLGKQPKTNVERLACLGYYLTHHRDMPQFRTIDLSKLNTEAAQRKFANAADTAKDAIRANYFVAAPKKGHRQLSAEGEQAIAALPDHEKAAGIMKRVRSRRIARKSCRQKTRPANK